MLFEFCVKETVLERGFVSNMLTASKSAFLNVRAIGRTKSSGRIGTCPEFHIFKVMIRTFCTVLPLDRSFTFPPNSSSLVNIDSSETISKEIFFVLR